MISDNTARNFYFVLLAGLGILLMVFVAAMVSHQRTLESYTALAASTGQWEERLNGAYAIQGEAYGLIADQIGSQSEASVRAQAIDDGVRRIHAAWSELNTPTEDPKWAVVLERSGSAVSEKIDQLSIEALRGALALRRGEAGENQVQRARIEATHQDLSVVLTGLQSQISAARAGSQTGQTQAMVAAVRAEKLMIYKLLAFVFVAAIGIVLFGFDSRRASRRQDAGSVLSEAPPRDDRRAA